MLELRPMEMVKQDRLRALPAVKVPDCPEGRRHIVIAKFSGGRSSALACKAAVEQGVADRVIFNNTGLESPETYAFVEAVNLHWLDGRLEILEWRRDGVRQLRDVADCAKQGEPMRELVEQEFLPTPLSRVCTKHLKIRATLSSIYAGMSHKEYRLAKVSSVIGFRADEPARVAKMLDRNDAIAMREDAGRKYLKWTDMQIAPLADAGWTRDDVLEYYRRHRLPGLRFDPGLPNVRLSNCLGCFLSGQAELVRVAREEPWYAGFWDGVERDNYAKRKVKLDRSNSIKEKRIRAAGEEPRDEYERTAYAAGRLPWSVLRRMAKRERLPVQSSVFEAGGCGDGDCGLDL